MTSAGPGSTTGTAGPVRYVVVGGGWRAESYLRLAAVFPDRLRTTAVVARSDATRARVGRQWGVPSVATVEEAVAAERPDFVVTAVPWAVSPTITREAVALDLPVLSETPPAPDVPGLVELWSRVGPSGLVQVAEQYPLYPGHAARLRLIENGVLGTVSNVQVSSTHQYHAVALMRAMLGVGFEDAAVSAFRSEFDLANPITRAGWTGDLAPQRSWNILAHFDFGAGRTGLYDFTDNQWHNALRGNRIRVRGSLGELVTDHVVHALDAATVLESDLVRRQTGVDLNLEGFDLDHIAFEGEVVYRNPWQGGRVADDEIAVATLLGRTGAWARGEGPPPYPLAQACQDHMLALAIDDSVASGGPVRTTRQAWAG